MLLPNYDELMDLRKKLNPIHLLSKKKVKTNVFGGRHSAFKGRGLDFSEFREYTHGDEIKSIDWRVTARTGKTHTKIFTEDRERSVYVLVDLNSYMDFGTRQTFKSIQAARAAALIMWRAHRLHDKAGAILFGQVSDRIQFLPSKRGRKSIFETLKILCSPRSQNSPAAGLEQGQIENALLLANQRVPTGSCLFIISDFFNISDEFERQLGILSRKCEVNLIKVNDPADAHLAAVDELVMADGSGQRLAVNTNYAKGRNAYQTLWQENEFRLKEVGRRFRIPILALSTDREVSL